MRKLLTFLFTFALFLCVTGAAYAIPYTDMYDVGSKRLNEGDSLHWVFDITDDGFNPETQDVTSADVTLKFFEHGWDWIGLDEHATLDVGENSFTWEVDEGNIKFTIESLMTLSDTGTIDCTLKAIDGNFIFKSAILNAEGTEPAPVPPTPTPEPATLVLLGLGLLGLAGARRKKI